ncbi:DUF2878 domain-containing protein [Pseudomonas sp. TCU-HL1]|uniref:DUF2878 domain-containing protein n=1 Tax=Pseudomonas sp. TCU-HL1 TaxID=1856685 RepID=UPI00083DA08D|nr:DUF2878 domain-containing protein [Pseudomonas sp. TCU-HL1]AOE87382.1 hypothetical protein THL1_4834 [Pseudomonas sp. TCU-HL1]
MPRLVANAVLFQIGWLACVFGSHQPWLLLAVPLILAVHFCWIGNWQQERKLLLIVFLAGSLLDTALIHLGVFHFPGTDRVLPLWLALLWSLLATTLNHSLAWSARPWWRASLLGGLCAPPAYLIGARLADVGLPLGLWISAGLLSLVWAMVLPALHGVSAWGRADT